MNLTADQYRDLKNYGFSDKEIMKMFHVSGNKFYKWKKEKGIDMPRSKKKKVINLTRVEYENYKKKGITDHEIMKKIQIDSRNFINWKRENGIVLKRQLKLKVNKEDYEKYRDEGLTNAEIAECIYGVTPGYFSNKLRQWGIVEKKEYADHFTLEEYQEKKRRGMNEQEIMRDFGFKYRETYNNHKRRLGIPMMRTNKLKKRSPELGKKVIELRGSGLSAKEVAKKIGVSYNTVLKVSYEYHAKKRSEGIM